MDNKFQDMPFTELSSLVSQDPATSFWLRDAIASLSDRDPVDAIRDIKVLDILFEKRLQEIQATYTQASG